jgi:hypothetical protein
MYKRIISLLCAFTIIGSFNMKMTFKKITAAVMAVTTLAVSMVGMGASAASVGNINLHKAAGAPGSATVTHQYWNFTTSSSTFSMNITSFTKSGSDSYVFLYGTVDDSVKIATQAYGTGGISATNITLGRPGYASASLNNFSSGTHQAFGTVSG